MIARLFVGAGLVSLGLVVPAPVVDSQSIPVPVTAPDPALQQDLDAVLALSPPDTCLTVSIDGTVAFDHRGTDPQVPASTQKLITVAAALDAMGPDATYTTEAVAAGPVVDGTLAGDLVLVGAGDPVLVTAATAREWDLPEERPRTTLDRLADELVASGLRRVEGSVLADEGRYDTLRAVPSWPQRHLRDNLSGPLSAAAVDKGYLVRSEGDRTTIVRSPDPAGAAAGALTWMLASRGVEVLGAPATGGAGTSATALAAVRSPALAEIAADVLARSDNTAAEMLLKELGALDGDGSTAGGARAAAAWLNEQALAEPGASVVDGSGLDTGNQVSCHELVGVLDNNPALEALLPVAGRSGTLADRFEGTAAAGRLRAKTGSLNEVTSLAGHVELPDGGTATFAYIANGELLNAELLRAQDFLAEILATYRPPCPRDRAEPIVDPTLARLGQLGVATGPAAAGASPAMAASVIAMQGRAVDLVDRCTRADGAAVVLAPAGRAN